MTSFLITVYKNIPAYTPAVIIHIIQHIALGKAEEAAEAPAEMAGAFRLGCCTEGMGYLFGIMDRRRTDGG